MAMLLSYNIVSCTSEDGDHPVRELQDFHAQSRGWQSARWCDFPQALVVQFPGRVSLQQVQVLSHQFKISSRIEIFIGDMPPGVPVPVTGTDGVEYTRLGHFSLDSNERSGFQARELKTVYVPRASEGRFLKLLLHKCHVNEHNLYNQLGLLAVRAIGTGPGAIAGHGMPVQPEPISMQAQAAGPLRGEPQPSHEPPPHESPGASMDPAVISMIRELEEQKRSAVAAEDFDEAKRLKARIEQLKGVGVSLAALERKKASAIHNEDYDAAKDLKEQVRSSGGGGGGGGGSSSSSRSSGGGGGSSSSGGGGTSSASSSSSSSSNNSSSTASRSARSSNTEIICRRSAQAASPQSLAALPQRRPLHDVHTVSSRRFAAARLPLSPASPLPLPHPLSSSALPVIHSSMGSASTAACPCPQPAWLPTSPRRASSLAPSSAASAASAGRRRTCTTR